MNENCTFGRDDRPDPMNGSPRIAGSRGISAAPGGLGVLALLCASVFIVGCRTNRVGTPSLNKTPISHVRPELRKNVARVAPDADRDVDLAGWEEPMADSDTLPGLVLTIRSVEETTALFDDASDERIEPIDADLVSIAPRPRESKTRNVGRSVLAFQAIGEEAGVLEEASSPDAKPAGCDLTSTKFHIPEPEEREIEKGSIETRMVMPDVVPKAIDGRALVSILTRQRESQKTDGADTGSDATIRLVQGEAEMPVALPDENVKPIQPELAPVEVAAEELESADALDMDLSRIDEPSDEAEAGEPTRALGREHYSIAEVTTDIAAKDGTGGFPEEEDRIKIEEGDKTALEDEISDYAFADRVWMGYLYQWQAASLCHQPLYFEEVNIERYGYSRHPLLQPVVSGAHFFATVPVLPYKMTVEPPRRSVYTLGYYRPGSRVPYRWNRMPLRPKGGLVEAGVITGLIYAIP